MIACAIQEKGEHKIGGKKAGDVIDSEALFGNIEAGIKLKF